MSTTEELKPSKGDDAVPAEDTPEEPQQRFSPEEEKTLLEESNSLKSEANNLFGAGKYQDAIAKYQESLNSCPNYLHYPRAVLQSNVAASHLKLEEWKEAIKAATASLDLLTTLQAEAPVLADQEASGVVELPDAADEEASLALLSQRADIQRIRTKALLRRARARSEAGGWQNLAGAEEDYKTLAQTPDALTPADRRTVQTQLRLLPPRSKAAQEKEVGEMWGKLKGLGDGILKPFGLSTDNFKMVKDEATGGYSVNFSQGGGEGASNK